MVLTDLLDTWQNTPTIKNNIAAWKTFPGHPAKTSPLPADLHPALAGTLRAQGIEALYSHQAAAWEHIRAGQHPVIVTGTASGKTLCYNLPVLQNLLHNPDARALYLFPAKALAHDQRNQLTIFNEQLTKNNPLVAATYDGDTPVNMRPSIRSKARIILSNPDMLHTGVLPHHTRWAEFFSNLRFVVIDEMHVYRGVFGSHVANVLRRLKRVSRFYGAAPQFILTSATIANPAAFAERLIEEPTALVDNDGAARGTKHFLIYNPPIIDKNLGLRRSTLQESIRLTQELLHQNVQTLVFARTRRTVEILLTHLRKFAGTAPATNFSPAPPHPSASAPTPTIRAYRSGYLPRQRREIERGLRSGKVQAVVATSALELGIDIGSMGAAVLTGYPGTIAGTWQQAGRAGRTDDTSLALLITSPSPLDQFLARHPAYFFERPPEQALINPDNLLILLQHLRCAAFELPFQRGKPFGRVSQPQLAEFLEFLQESGDLHLNGQKFFWMADRYPAGQVSLRSTSPSKVRLLTGDDAEQWTTIGEVDAASAPWMVHPKAIYLHEGQGYQVQSLDLEQQVAHLHPVNVNYYTEPIRNNTVSLIKQKTQSHVPGGAKNHGDILVTTQVVGYNVVHWYTRERLGGGEVDLPPGDLHTTGYWLTVAPETVAHLRKQGLWSNDPNDYGPNWQEQRKQARARDGYRCQMCGTPEMGRRHDVHHATPFRTFGSYRQANQLSNLITLCRACHRRAETTVRMRSGLSGLATALGHLAPLFLMCDTHDVGLHADPESPLADGRPAIVIYDMVPAGIGFSERLFELHQKLITHAHQLVAACPCPEGCPSCIGPAGENGVGGKRETLALLEVLG